MPIAGVVPYSFTLDYSDFVKGTCSFSELQDATFKDKAGNPFYSPGFWGNPPSFGTAVSSPVGPTRGIVSYGKAKGSLSLAPMCVATNGGGDGYFFTMNTGSGTITQVGMADTLHDYSEFSDTVFYKGYYFTTTKDDITRNDIPLTTRDTSYWVATLGKPALFPFNPHPMIVYADIVFIADGQYLHKIDGMFTGTTNVLDLGSDWVITALAEYQGLIYISAERYWNASGTQSGISKIVTWNSYSPSFINEWNVNYRISCLYPFGRLLYVFSKTAFGYWDGAEIKLLRRTQSQIYKYQITQSDYSLWYVDFNKMIRYGLPLVSSGSSKRFYEFGLPDNISVGSQFVSIVSLQYNNMFVGFLDGATFRTYYIDNVNSPPIADNIDRTYIFSERSFKQSIVIRGVIIETTALKAAQKVKLSFQDQTGVTYDIATFDGANPLHVTKTRYTFDFFKLLPTRAITPVVTVTNDVLIRSIQYVYEPTEVPTNQ